MRGPYTFYATHQWPLWASILIGVITTLLVIATSTPSNPDQVIFEHTVDITPVMKVIHTVENWYNFTPAEEVESKFSPPWTNFSFVLNVGFLLKLGLVVTYLGFFRGFIFAMDATLSLSRQHVTRGVRMFVRFLEALVIANLLLPREIAGLSILLILGFYTIWIIARWPHPTFRSRLFWGTWAVLGCLSAGELSIFGAPLKPAFDQFPELICGALLRTICTGLIFILLLYRGLYLFFSYARHLYSIPFSAKLIDWGREKNMPSGAQMASEPIAYPIRVIFWVCTMAYHYFCQTVKAAIEAIKTLFVEFRPDPRVGLGLLMATSIIFAAGLILKANDVWHGFCTMTLTGQWPWAPFALVAGFGWCLAAIFIAMIVVSWERVLQLPAGYVPILGRSPKKLLHQGRKVFLNLAAPTGGNYYVVFYLLNFNLLVVDYLLANQFSVFRAGFMALLTIPFVVIGYREWRNEQKSLEQSEPENEIGANIPATFNS